MAPFRLIAASAIALALIFPSGKAVAITAKDVVEKMSQQQRFAYLSGLLDMRAYQVAQSGNAAFAKCIYDSFYRDTESIGWASLINALEQFSDKQPATIVYVLTEKTCVSNK